MFDRLVVSFLVDEVVGGFFISVPPGHVACLYDRGRGVLKKVWGPGLHLKIPFWQVAKLFNAQTLEYGIRKGVTLSEDEEKLGDSPINAITKDNQEVIVEGAILFKINKEMITQLWENIGEKFISKILRPISRSVIRSIISNFNSNEVVTANRPEVEKQIQKALEDELHSKGLIVEKVLLSEVSISK